MGRSRYQLAQPTLDKLKTFSLIFRLKPYFLCSLINILAWNYLFSVTQMNVCFCYLCQAECRENSVLQEVVGFTVLGKKNPKTLLHTQLPEKHAEACTRCLPGSPAHATPTSCSCMHCLQMLQTTPCQLIPTPAMLHM